MIKYMTFLTMFLSCAINANKQLDQIQFVLKLLKSNDHKILSKRYGQPTSSKIDKQGLLEYYEQTDNDQHTFQVLWDQELKQVKSIQVFLWSNYDNYEYVKEKLGKYKWVEKQKELKSHKHYIGDIREVSIPEINASFEYQADAVNRKILYLFFRSK